MISRFTFALLVALSFSSCQSPFKKKDEEDKKPLKNMAGDVNFQAFIGRLRIAAKKRDLPMLQSMMAPDFGYRWDTSPPGENVFAFWDKNNLWPELAMVLEGDFAPHRSFMVAPASGVQNPQYRGRLAGMTVVAGSWKFGYFLPPPESQSAAPAPEPGAPQPAVEMEPPSLLDPSARGTPGPTRGADTAPASIRRGPSPGAVGSPDVVPDLPPLPPQ